MNIEQTLATLASAIMFIAFTWRKIYRHMSGRDGDAITAIQNLSVFKLRLTTCIACWVLSATTGGDV